jgi:glycosyltransferase involved in cell wall biosynthesis
MPIGARRRSRPYRAPSFRCLFIVYALASLSIAFPSISHFRLSVRELFRGAQLSVLMVIFNKAAYLNRSLSSILNLTLAPHRFSVICVDDGSTDNSSLVVAFFAMRLMNLRLVTHPSNLGTHRARITAVRNARTPFLTFLDPDDEFTGMGLEAALDTIIEKDADIVEFGCHTITWNETLLRCWLLPRIREAEPARYARLYYRGRINSHVHRKIIRTELYKKAIDAMPESVVNRRLIRYEDKLHYAFIIANMTRKYYFLNVLGEFRYWGLEDNSQTETYQSANETAENDEYVSRVILETFNRVAK